MTTKFVVRPDTLVLSLYEVAFKDNAGVKHYKKIASTELISENLVQRLSTAPENEPGITFASFEEAGYKIVGVRNIGFVSIPRQDAMEAIIDSAMAQMARADEFVKNEETESQEG